MKATKRALALTVALVTGLGLSGCDMAGSVVFSQQPENVQKSIKLPQISGTKIDRLAQEIQATLTFNFSPEQKAQMRMAQAQNVAQMRMSPQGAEVSQLIPSAMWSYMLRGNPVSPLQVRLLLPTWLTIKENTKDIKELSNSALRKQIDQQIADGKLPNRNFSDLFVDFFRVQRFNELLKQNGGLEGKYKSLVAKINAQIENQPATYYVPGITNPQINQMLAPASQAIVVPFTTPVTVDMNRQNLISLVNQAQQMQMQQQMQQQGQQQGGQSQQGGQ